MQSLFIVPPHVSSPRWLQAFPSAHVVTCQDELPVSLQGLLLWVYLDSAHILSLIPAWVAAGAKIIVLTQAESAAQAKQVLEAGASGYLHYLAAATVLEQIAQVVVLGGLWLGADLMRQLVLATATSIGPSSLNNPLALLSPREQEVASSVAAGRSNKEVARDLGITERTVKAHLSAVFEKLQARDRLHLVLILTGR